MSMNLKELQAELERNEYDYIDAEFLHEEWVVCTYIDNRIQTSGADKDLETAIRKALQIDD